MRLLIAEDEADLNRILCERLRKEGYAVDSCYDGMTLFGIWNRSITMALSLILCFRGKADLKFCGR